ncbi:4-hydroxybenzoate polyprenyltransferase, mitochondrial [Smittium mucronatum]|uniref:4-hydroxybenzoate polyprenyltransferase, mitochondrial n=1 Tax=Smittium mucronatum TaxID=133383 RepID=A0A1R0H2S1_9FUNG|nr:4-hydroxybenzoate polyprenyltransferase, mitochondrial [Smittium mucronatum]
MSTIRLSRILQKGLGSQKFRFSSLNRPVRFSALPFKTGSMKFHCRPIELSYTKLNNPNYSTGVPNSNNVSEGVSGSENVIIHKEKLGKINGYFNLMRLDKPIGTMLLLWPCTWSIGLASASGNFSPYECFSMLTLFGAGALVMRGAGCTVNDLWDIKFDRKVERTKNRPLASGQITKSEAIVFLGAQLSVGLAILLQLNNFTIFLGSSSLILVVLYPYMKRITFWPQSVLGLAYNWGALLGWSAMYGSLDISVCLPLYMSGICWTLVYDTIYAHQDKADDIHVGVKSTALLFAENTKPIIAAFSVATVSFLALSGYNNGCGPLFYLGSVIGGSLHLSWIIYKVNLDSTSSCWKYFKSNTWFGFIVFASIMADYFYRSYNAPDQLN